MQQTDVRWPLLGFLDDCMMHALQASDSEGVILISSKFCDSQGLALGFA